MDEARCLACGAEVSEIDLRCPRCGAPTAGGTAEPAGGGSGELAPGEVVSHFRIVGRLGRGGMGTVYRAADLELGREVALKFLHPEPAGEGDLRFSREARAVAALDHPNIATLYEIGEHRGRRFLALALYEGETLCQRLERGPLAVGEAGALAAQIAAALAAAHAAGIVHRDLKPDNLLLLGNGRLKLLDFGLARPREATPLTQPGMAPGTLAYMPPEVLRGEAAGPAADVWALGVVLCEALAGRHPLRGAAEASSWLEAVLLADPTPLPAAVPEALGAIVARCLDKDPGRRFRDGGEAAQALSAAGYLAESSVPAQPVERPRKARWRLGLAAALLAVLAGIATLAYRGLQPAPPLAVAALPAEIRAEEPEAAEIRLNLQVAVLRALVALQGVSAFDSEALRGLPGEPRAAARALAADQIVTASADCKGDLCQVVLRRLDGRNGAVLWTEGLALPPSRPQLFAEAVTAAVRRGFGERRGKGLAAPDVKDIEEADYRKYLSVRQGLNARLLTPQAGLAELTVLRRRAPELLEAAVLEGSLCRNLYESSGDAGYLERGLAGMRQAVRRAPDNPRPLSILFDLALTGGRLDEAAAALRQIEALDPGGAGLPLRQAQFAERQGRLEEAARLLAQAADRRPTWQVLLAAANLEYRLGHLEAARRDLATLLARSPGHVEGTATLAQIELLDGDPARALALLAELHTRAPSPEVAGNLGIARMLLGRYAEAEATFRGLLSAQPGDPQIALNLADALALQGRTDEAQRFYRQTAETPVSDPPSWSVHSVRAQAQAHLGRRQAAVASLERALRMTPDNAQLAFEAALVFTLLGDRGSALFHAERALAGGVSPRWLGFPWFAELRTEPALAARLAHPKPTAGKL